MSNNKQQNTKNQTSDKNKKISRYKNVYMEEESPQNPFGPNYYRLPYMAKVSYKYSKMKQFILPEKKDIIRKEDEEAKYIGSLLLGISGGFAIGGAIKIFFDKIFEVEKLSKWIYYNQNKYYPIMAAATTAYVYFIAQQRFNQQVCVYFVDKYLKQAIENGFKDYEISK